MIVNIEEVRRVLEYLTHLNETPLAEIQLWAEGKPVTLDPQDIQEFKFMGLSNKSFFELLNDDFRLNIVRRTSTKNAEGKWVDENGIPDYYDDEPDENDGYKFPNRK